MQRFVITVRKIIDVFIYAPYIVKNSSITLKNPEDSFDIGKTANGFPTINVINYALYYRPTIPLMILRIFKYTNTYITLDPLKKNILPNRRY